MASITQMIYALELERQQSFLNAAKKSFVTQPTLSMQIQKLEQEYDVQLFDRSRHPIVPTPIGFKMLRQFQKVVEEASKVQDILAQEKGVIIGDYRLGVIPTLAPQILPKLYKSLLAKYPLARFEFVEASTGDIVNRLVGGDLDGGLLSTPLNDSRILETPIFNEELVVFYGRDLDLKLKEGLKEQKTIRVRDLPLDKIILLQEGHCLRDQVVDLCALNDERRRSKLGLSIEVGSLALLVQLVLGGGYFSILPELLVQTFDPKWRDRHICFLDHPRTTREVGLVSHRAQIKATTNRAIVQEVKCVLKKLVNNERTQ